MEARPLPRTAPRAILYLRQSTHRDDSVSLEQQESAGREYCMRKGYTIVGVESDPGISGRTWNRPAVQRVMASVAAGGADVVVLWKWSRLSRSRLDWAVAVDKVESAGGRIESATEPLDTTTSSGRLARGMLAEFAAFESERIGDGWKETHERRRRSGLPAQGGRRFGYRIEGRAYIIDETEGPLLADMYRRWLAGEGFTRIARAINDTGIPTSAGGQWTRSYITRLLDAGFGAGQIMKRGERYSDLLYYPGAHEAVITPEEWQEYRTRRGEAPLPAATIEPKYILTGLIKCDDCDAPMHSSNAGGKRRSYSCSGWLHGKSVRCVTCIRSNVEDYVLKWLRGFMADVDTAAGAAARAAEKKVTVANNARTINLRIAKVDQELGKLTVSWLAGDVLDVAYKATTAALAEKHARLTAQLAGAQRNSRRDFDIESIAITVRRWDELEILEKRELLASIIKEVRVIPPAERGRGGNNREGSAKRVRFEVIPLWADE